MENALESLSREALIALIGQKDVLLKERDSVIQQKETEIAKLRRMLFGQKRERFETSPIQLPLDFGEALSEQEIKELEEFINKKTEAVKQQENKAPRGSHPGRSPLPKHLTVQQLILEPQQDTTDMVLIGNEVTDSLQYEPSRFYIQRIVRPKYAPKAVVVSEEHIRIIIAELPGCGFGKCIAGTGLIAQILIDKYCDHLPLYRQLQRFKREGIEIAPATMDHWVKLGMQRLELLYEYQKTIVLKSNYLQVDETVCLEMASQPYADRLMMVGPSQEMTGISCKPPCGALL